MLKYIFVFIFSTVCLSGFSQTKDSIPASESVNHYNETIKIYGTVSGGRKLTSSKITLINVDGLFPNHALSLMIKDENLSKFSYTPETFLKNKKIVISGVVIKYKEKPEMIITDPAQIKIVD
jgi:hypothetical protein